MECSTNYNIGDEYVEFKLQLCNTLKNKKGCPSTLLKAQYFRTHVIRQRLP